MSALGTQGDSNSSASPLQLSQDVSAMVSFLPPTLSLTLEYPLEINIKTNVAPTSLNILHLKTL